MKTRYISIVAMTLIAGWAHAQYDAENYVQTNVFRKEVTIAPTSPDTSQAVQSTQYYDGLGRPIQTVVKQGSPDGKDLVNQIGYDTYGRQHRTYLPFEASHSLPGNYHGDWQNEINTFYNDADNGVANESGHYYNETVYESSPLSRPIKAYGAGSAWRTADRYVSTVFDYNSAADAIPHFDVDTDASQTVTYTGLYADGELTKTVTYDEDGNRTEEFTDKLGRVLTKKTQIDASNDAVTHYLYDDYGMLTFVIQPQGVIEGGTAWDNNLNSTAFRKSWMFRYKYDWRGQVIEKQVPGSEPVHMIYDRRGRVRMTQSGNERTGRVVTGDIQVVTEDIYVDQFTGKSYEIQGSGSVTLEAGFSVVASESTEFEVTTQGAVADKWTVTKYDDSDRPVMTGFYYTSDRKETLEQTVSQSEVYGESYTGSGPLGGYTNDVFPAITEENLLTVTYYDNYDFASDKVSIMPTHAFDGPKGQVTGALARILGEDQMLRTVSFYDDRSRPIKTITENHKGGEDIVETTYKDDVSSLVTRTVTTHTSSDHTGTLTVTEAFFYDHMDRLEYATHRVGSGTEVRLIANEYNEIGQLRRKRLHSEDGGVSFAQDIDHTYNIRGWLGTINDGNSLSGKDKFGMELQYDNAPSGHEQYNGNIGAMVWSTLGGGQDQGAQEYRYTYDMANRLRTASYKSSGKDGHFDVGGDDDGIRYDANGNIINLTRYFDGGLADDLSYSYVDGNQLSEVSDAASSTLFSDRDPANDGPDYTYDANGNMVSDHNKDIVSISYNHLDLPELVTKANGDHVKYTYDATGLKLQKEAKTGAYVAVTDYVAGKHYVDGALSFFQHAEGRVVKNGSAFDYEYDLTDHLGNVRASVDEGGNVIQRDEYYPFGLTFNSYTSGTKNNYQYNQGTGEKTFKTERQEELGLDMTKFRMYDYAIGRFLSVDPLAHMAPGWTPYRAFYNNPIYYIDPTGLLESTHTDEDGNVIAVYDDGDNGVYKHANGTTKEDLDKTHGSLVLQNPTGAGGERMGETEHWDEFVSPETGETMTNYRIQYGKSFDPIIDRMNKNAQGMDLKEIAAESGPGGDFDIKVPYKNVGALLNGKYSTSRSAGNYLAGYNAQGGTYFGVSISFDTFQKLAGGLHVKGSLTNKEKAGVVLFGTSYGDPPAYGEVMYQYRMSKAGWDKAKLNNK